jgi:8-oxo-dGTP diphosphatase
VKCTVYEFGKLKDYKYVVTFAVYEGRWLLCKHRERNTWEVSGGHVEAGETPLEAARRELFEETGALDFTLEPVCDYWACDEPHETKNITWSNGQVFFADVKKLGPIPESEMEKIEVLEMFPDNLTYPDITAELLPYVVAAAAKTKKEFSGKILYTGKELKISEMLRCQTVLWEKHKDSWEPMTPKSARNYLLWMFEEIGEVIAIIKKRGEKDIMNDGGLKNIFTEELVDIFMYYLHILNNYEISAMDFSAAYIKKNNYNQTRDFEGQHRKFLRNDLSS